MREFREKKCQNDLVFVDDFQYYNDLVFIDDFLFKCAFKIIKRKNHGRVYWKIGLGMKGVDFVQGDCQVACQKFHDQSLCQQQ